MSNLTRRKCIAGAAVAPLTWATKAGAEPVDPLIDLCAEHDRVFAEYRRVDQAYDRGELSIEELEKYADPILDQAYALTDRICATQATSVKGLELQYRHLIERMFDDVRDNFSDKWAAIFDSMLAGFENLTGTSGDVTKTERQV